jgi:predicted ATP-grasp superfamily ATP-dependent carboligase
MRVLITNARNRIAYAAMRSLGCRGISICTADSIPWAMCFSSRYSRSHFRYPSFFQEPEKCIASLIENGRKARCQFLLPTYEETFLIAKHQDRLKPHFRLVVPEYEKILAVHDKQTLCGLAGSLGIPVPRTAFLTEHPSLYPWLDEVSYPVWLKPRQGGGAWGIEQIASYEELLLRWTKPDCRRGVEEWDGGRVKSGKVKNTPTLQRPVPPSPHLPISPSPRLPYGLPAERFLVQEHIPGEIFCVAMLFNQGKMRARFTYRQERHYPLRGGVATLRVSDRQRDAENYLQRLLEALQWHGVCQADFVVHRDSKVPYLLDVNPRFWSATHLAVISGVDFPYLMYRIAADGDADPVLEHPTGIHSRWFWGELRAFWECFCQPGQKIRALKTYGRFGGAYSNFDDLCLRDPLPPLVFFGDSIRRIVKQRSLTLRPHDSLEGVWE